ncbi:S-adenosyl-L-methionine-dependent methyltransferases superfamily protein [Rhynchospora pubera]|uniref:S-adenosyl-L-methionine-dependent methyltransferases superfamily protein n=1 Tax=Rhynchospora pubera TaxID=906938 RepID=A0AAV8DCL3_9POAL|nr:S-adenosyl-L-methionine-dependent methyltransferases superfamily protein [Rhynchospora pubera]
MALFERNPGRRPSNSYSTATFVVFVALVLVGVWMLSSSTFTPASLPSENKSETNEVSETESIVTTDEQPVVEPTNTRQEDTNPDANTESSSNETENKMESENKRENGNENEGENGNGNDSVSSDEQKGTQKVTEKSDEKIEEENSSKPSGDTKSESESKADTENKPSEEVKGQSENGMPKFDDETGKTEGGELVTPGEGTQELISQNKTTELENSSGNSTESFNEKSDERGSEQITSNDETNNSENDKGFTTETITSENQSETNTGSGQEKVEQELTSGHNNTDIPMESFPNAAQSELLNETSTQNGTFSTQAAESRNQKEVRATSANKKGSKDDAVAVTWKLCNTSAGADYIPCLDNVAAIKKLRTTRHYEHRERHCPDESPTCLVPLPEGYKKSIEWPHSRDKIWYHNVPHTLLADVKGHQNWVKVSGEYLSFPGGGTQFIKGALHYIDNIQESLPDIAWGNKTRVVLDVGCGVASFGGFLFERDVLTMSFAPKDEHEAQVQFALERGIPAISAVMGTKRLPYPSLSFDVIHCARCRVPWHVDGGMLLLELNRLLRPGGYFVWSATPVYQSLPEDVEIWQAMSDLMKAMCWKIVIKTKDTLNKVGLAIYQKPSDNKCYDKRKENSPPMCQESDDPNAAWNISLQACMHKLPVDPNLRGSKWPEQWPKRLVKAPYWLNESQTGVYGKPAPKDFEADYAHWKHVVNSSYINGMGIDWSHIRNVMDMRAVYGGFAAALRDMKVWVMNVVPIDSPDTLPVIYERGLFGMYHNWCESFSTYPRSYDLLHADHLFSRIKKKCKILPLMAEVDRMLRPEGKLIVRDNLETINEIESIAKSLKYEVRMTYTKEKQGLLCVQKTVWRPTEVEVENSTLPLP